MSERASGQGVGGGWRRWHAVPVVLLALAADYGSPAALWTAIIPLAFMAVLLTFRERTAALVVLFLSSWVAIPALAGARVAIDSARGVHRLVAIDDHIPGVPLGAPDCLRRAGALELDVLSPGGSGRDGVLASYASLHNTFAMWSFGRDGLTCQSLAPSTAPAPALD